MPWVMLNDAYCAAMSWYAIMGNEPHTDRELDDFYLMLDAGGEL